MEQLENRFRSTFAIRMTLWMVLDFITRVMANNSLLSGYSLPNLTPLLRDAIQVDFMTNRFFPSGR